MENSNFRLSHTSTEVKSDEADFRQDKRKAAADITEKHKFNSKEKSMHNASQHPLPPPERRRRRRKGG